MILDLPPGSFFLINHQDAPFFGIAEIPTEQVEESDEILPVPWIRREVSQNGGRESPKPTSEKLLTHTVQTSRLLEGHLQCAFFFGGVIFKKMHWSSFTTHGSSFTTKVGKIFLDKRKTVTPFETCNFFCRFFWLAPDFGKLGSKKKSLISAGWEPCEKDVT